MIKHQISRLFKLLLTLSVLGLYVPLFGASQVIDDFENNTLTSPLTWTASDAVAASILSGGYADNYALNLTGPATNYYVGYLSAYTGGYDWQWTNYNYLSIWVKNQGAPKDKLKVEIFDNDNSNWSVDSGPGASGDDKFMIELTLLNTHQWQQLFIPLNGFRDDNPGIGNDTMDLSIIPGTTTTYPSVVLLGFAIISSTPSGSVNFIVDNISLQSASPTLDSDLDGMSDSWEDAFGLNKNSAQDALTDLDGDGYNNFNEYINQLNPTSGSSTPSSLSSNITLKSGWNMITAGPDYTSASGLYSYLNSLGAGATKLYVYNNDSWIPYPGTNSSLSADTPVMVYNTNTFTYTVSSSSASSTYSFQSGNNMFVSPENVTRSVASLIYSINSPNIRATHIYRFDHGSWVVYTASNYGVNFPINPAEAYVIYTNQDFSWSP